MADPKPSNFLPTYEQFGQLGNQPINTNIALNTNFRFILNKVPGVTYFCTSITTPSSSSSLPGDVSNVMKYQSLATIFAAVGGFLLLGPIH